MLEDLLGLQYLPVIVLVKLRLPINAIIPLKISSVDRAQFSAVLRCLEDGEAESILSVDQGMLDVLLQTY